MDLNEDEISKDIIMGHERCSICKNGGDHGGDNEYSFGSLINLPD